MFTIAGPCGIENKELFEQTISFLLSKDVKYIRGGTEKYRSDPLSYQGDIKLLEVVKELKQKYDFKFVTEIFKVDDYVKQFEDIIDVIQVGSRNMMNTSLLKDISSKLPYKKVMFKRHFSSSLYDFVEHSKYLETNEIWYCLRGIQSLFPGEQRFQPDITDISRLREMTHEKIIYDVSHAACRHRFVPTLAKAAKVYGADGIMVEVHSRPSIAESDKMQQLNFNEFSELMEDL